MSSRRQAPQGEGAEEQQGPDPAKPSFWEERFKLSAFLYPIPSTLSR